MRHAITRPYARSILLVACALLAASAGYALARSGDPPTAKRLALAQSRHVRGAPGRTLGLQKTIIPPGVHLPLHHHEGTQVAYIAKGRVTYTVHRGSATIKRGLADQHPRLVRRLRAGETATMRPGDWIIEQPSDHHSAVNRTSERTVIYQATLLRTGAPPATPG